MHVKAQHTLFEVGPNIPRGVAFVPCAICRVPVDLAWARFGPKLCPACTLTTVVRRPR